MRREIIIGLLALSSLVGLASPGAYATGLGNRGHAAELKKLHILMVLDTRASDLSKSVRIDEWRMRRLWRETIPSSRYQLTVITGEQVSRSRILAHYQRLRLGPSEGVLFYYAGHAATDIKTGKHYFDLAGDKPLFRHELVKGMEATRAGLVVLLTDCCSTPREIIPREGLDDEGESFPLARGTVTTIHPTVRHLLFLTRGTVDVTAATDNASWSDVLRGGLFTRSLYLMFRSPVRNLDINRDGTVTWQEFFPQLQKETQNLYLAWRKEMIARGETDIGERIQKPYAFNLGQILSRILPRHAVIRIENSTAKTLRYSYRWDQQNDWSEVQLRPGQKSIHVLQISSKIQLPRLETRFSATGRPRLLAAGEWYGEGKPDAEVGKFYRLRIGQE